MQRYIISRILLMIPTLLGVAIISFALLRMVPGDIVTLKLAGDGGRVDEKVLQQERARLGLDKPIPQQFAELDSRRGATSTSASRCGPAGRSSRRSGSGWS